MTADNVHRLNRTTRFTKAMRLRGDTYRNNAAWAAGITVGLSILFGLITAEPGKPLVVWLAGILLLNIVATLFAMALFQPLRRYMDARAARIAAKIAENPAPKAPVVRLR